MTAESPAPMSILLPVRNEEMNIRQALESVSGWAGELWVVDSNSTDRTVAIASEYTDRIVQEITGQSLADFATDNIFKPLGLNDTTFCPARHLHDRIAPTKSLEKAIAGDDGV